MDLPSVFQTRWAVVILFSFLFTRASSAGPGSTYCSSDNTAGGSPSSSEDMSAGFCSDSCQGSFAFAVVQGNDCWCTNVAPAAQMDWSQCDDPCPGISTEWCGNEQANLFGYFQLPGGKPLGTSGAEAPQASSTPVFSSPSSIYSPPPPPPSSSSSRRPSSTIVVPYSSSYYSPPPPSSVSSTTRRPGKTEIYTSVTTVTGQIRTVVVTPTADATLGQSSTSGSSGVSAGKVAGIVVGIVLGLGILIGAIVWFCMRRRRKQRDSSPEGSFTADRLGPSGNAVPSRQVSQMSSAGLLGKGPRIQTNFDSNDNNDPRSAGTASSNNQDRRSLTTDQRLNPWALYAQEERLSNVSLQDNQDYSRQLRIANPD